MAGSQHDRAQTPPQIRQRRSRGRIADRLIAAAFAVLLLALPACAETFRVATFNAELSRQGPGILLRDLLRGQDTQIGAVVAEIIAADADVIALQGVDYDLRLSALSALADLLEDAGASYPHLYAAPPNAGRQTTFDLDGDGKTGGPGDAQGWGRFFGQGSMALLSRHPILTEEVTDHSTRLWRDLPGALLPQVDGTPFPSTEAQAVQRLSSHGHWIVPIAHPTFGRVDIMTYHATPPVFDGPEDRNGKRNHDETAFWIAVLDGRIKPGPMAPFVIAGDANLDPNRGDGLGSAMRTLLDHPRTQDPLPDQPTVLWTQTGPMRVDYVLPSSDWRVVSAGVRARNPDASRHALVWVELAR